MTDHPTVAPDAAPLTDPGPLPSRPGPWERFFSWVAGFGIVRTDGWIGGVCAGIAARLGVDPVIVRGIFVVAALFGLPMFIVYAVGWALLPDLGDRIHLRELLQRRFDPAMVGIALLLLIGLFPVVPWFLAVAGPFGYLAPSWFDFSPQGILTTLLVVTLIGGVIFLLARSASRRAISSGVPSVPDPRTASADPSAPGIPAATPDDSGVPVPAAADPATEDDVVSPAAAGSAPPPPASTATDDEILAWREQHAAWKAQDDAWRRQQKDAESAAREQARRERAAAGAAFAAEAAERRRLRRASKPRTSLAFVSFVIGAALVTGALTSLWSASAGPGDLLLAVACGLFAGALVVAIAMVVAGAIRRRSGFLAFVAVVLLIAGSLTAVVPVTRGIAFGGAYVTNVEPATVSHVWGPLDVYLSAEGAAPAPIVVEEVRGSTSIWVDAGVVLDLEVTGVAEVEWMRYDSETGTHFDDGVWAASSSSAGEPVVWELIDNSVDDRPVTTQKLTILDQSGPVVVTLTEPWTETP